MKNPVKLQYTINSSDLNVVGESLDYDWNTVCDEVDKHELYGQDGDGTISVNKNTLDEFKKDFGDILGHILFEIFKMNPNMTKLYINNNF